MNKHQIFINSLHDELINNGGIMPPSWVKWADMLKMLLTLARQFFPAVDAIIIDILLAAITAAEA